MNVDVLDIPYWKGASRTVSFLNNKLDASMFQKSGFIWFHNDWIQLFVSCLVQTTSRSEKCTTRFWKMWAWIIETGSLTCNDWNVIGCVLEKRGVEQAMGRLTNKFTHLDQPRATHIPGTGVRVFHHVFITATNYSTGKLTCAQGSLVCLLLRGLDMYVWKQLIPKCANGA